MITSIITTLIVAGLIYYLITLIPLPDPFPAIIRIVVIIGVVLYLLQFLHL